MASGAPPELKLIFRLWRSVALQEMLNLGEIEVLEWLHKMASLELTFLQWYTTKAQILERLGETD